MNIAPRCDHQPIFWIPPTEQWSKREKDPGDRALPLYLLPQPPELLEPIHPLGRVRTELSPSALYESHPFPVRTWHSDVPSVNHWFQESDRVWDSAHQRLQLALQCHKHHADIRGATTPTCHPGEKVWLSTRDIRLRLACKKKKKKLSR